MSFDILPTGKCFYYALDALYDLVKESPDNRQAYMLVHGILEAEDGDRFSHAWLESFDSCTDFGIIQGGPHSGLPCEFVIERAEYYRERRVKEVTHYTIEQAFKCNEETGHYGPWIEKYQNLRKDVKAAQRLAIED